MKIKNSKLILHFTLSFCLFIFVFFIGADEVKAVGASLYLSPSSGTYTVGNTFSVQAKVNSGGTAINTADGTLTFNPDKMEVIGVSKTDSIFSLWVQEPSFSNSEGTIAFAGGKPSPGFIGASGIIITVTFRAKTATFATANLTFAGGSVLADDGRGTNVLTNMNSGAYNFVSRETTPNLPPGQEGEQAAETSGGLAAPVVSSPSHPDPFLWYPNSDPEFNWQLPSGVTGASLLLHQKPDANPGLTSDGLISSKNYENIDDGIWYFHIRFRDKNGWGNILHRKVLIDTQSPDPFKMIINNEGDPTNPAPIIYFETTDSLSGIDYYEIKIGAQTSSTTQSSTIENPFRPPAIPDGKYTVEVKAFDKAGNFSLAVAELEIASLPAFLRFGKIALDFLTTMITLVVLIAGAIAIIFYTWYRISLWKKRISKETKEVSQSVAGAFRALRDEVEEQVSLLDKKPGLTKGEKETRDKLHEALDISEKFISEEIKDVEKELE